MDGRKVEVRGVAGVGFGGREWGGKRDCSWDSGTFEYLHGVPEYGRRLQPLCKDRHASGFGIWIVNTDYLTPGVQVGVTYGRSSITIEMHTCMRLCERLDIPLFYS